MRSRAAFVGLAQAHQSAVLKRGILNGLMPCSSSNYRLSVRLQVAGFSPRPHRMGNGIGLGVTGADEAWDMSCGRAASSTS